MRNTTLLFFFAIALHTSAQKRGAATRNTAPAIGERVEMINDSVRQTERFDSNTGAVLSRRFHVGERPVGVWQEFDARGQLLAVRDFGKLRYGSPPEATPPDTGKVTTVERMPEYPGGEAELFKFLAKSIRYPQEAQDEGLQGVVYITGVVEATGEWRTESIMRGAHPLLDYEAWRVMELMPVWSPGIVDGQPAAVRYNLPIRFRLR